MYLSRIQLRSDAAGRSGFWSRLDDIYNVHQGVWSLFSDGPDRRRDFLYRLDHGVRRPQLLALSARQPTDPDRLWKIETKPFEPAIEADDRLRFLLRANPVVTREGKRHDVVMDRKRELKEGGGPRDKWPNQAQIVQECGSAWLRKRAESHGFEVDETTLRVDGYATHRLRRRGGAEVRFSSCDFAGLLQVTEPAVFLKCLAQGLGPAKGFGCGLLLCARAAAVPP